MERHAGPLTVGPALIVSLAWRVLVISIGTMLLWFFLLRQDVMRANHWLFLTPVFGYGLAAMFLHERITTGDLVATIFMMAGCGYRATSQGQHGGNATFRLDGV